MLAKKKFKEILFQLFKTRKKKRTAFCRILEFKISNYMIYGWLTKQLD